MSMLKQKSTILIRFFSPQKGLKSGKRARGCHADYKGSWTAEDSRIPDQSSALPCPISAERARMCQWRTQCLEHHTDLGGLPFAKSCLFTIVFVLAPEEFQNSTQNQCFHGILMTLGSPVLWRKPDSLYVLRGSCMSFFMYWHFIIFIQVSWYSVVERKLFWNVNSYLVLSSTKLIFLPPSLQNVIIQLLLQITAIIQISRTQVYSGKPDSELKTWRIHNKAEP